MSYVFVEYVLNYMKLIQLINICFLDEAVFTDLSKFNPISTYLFQPLASKRE